MPLQNLNKNYDRNNKNMQKKYKTQLKMKRPYQYMSMATTVYKPVHETTETTKIGKVAGTIRGSCLIYADEHTKVFMNN